LIAYLDTSALIKMYLDESGRELVYERVTSASRIATALITYVEACAAFARLARESRASATDYRKLVAQLDANWQSYWIIELTRPVLRRASDLARRHALRAYDAVQLSSALELRGTEADVEFLSFDKTLNVGARRERLSVPAV
jgi:predicted nucleic acid-binding protein